MYIVQQLFSSIIEYELTRRHRRRIKTEEKAKVVASVWGVRIY